MQSLHSDWFFGFNDTRTEDLKCDVLFLSRLSSFSGGSGGMIRGHLFYLHEQTIEAAIVNIDEKH